MDYVTIYDLDGTLVDGDNLTAVFNALDEDDPRPKQAHDAYVRYDNHEIDLTEFLYEFYGALNGIDRDLMYDSISTLNFYEDVNKINTYMGEKGINQTIMSHSCLDVIHFWADLLPVNVDRYALELETKDNVFTGNFEKTPHNEILLHHNKQELIKTLYKDKNIIAFGDGRNDYEMLKNADIGFAIHARDSLLQAITDEDNIYVVDNFVQAIEILEQVIH